MQNKRTVFLVMVDDYHDIDMIASSIQGVELSGLEIGMSGGQYVGVVYSGNRPGDGEVFDLLLDTGIQLDNV